MFKTTTPNTAGLSLATAKARAKELRETLDAQGQHLTHAQALEKIAQHYGYRNWNTLRANIADHAPHGWEPGNRISGRYLGTPFQATLHRVTQTEPGWYRLTFDLDEPIDAVTFESFSNLRKRITCEVGDKGRSRAAITGGIPQVQIDL